MICTHLDCPDDYCRVYDIPAKDTSGPPRPKRKKAFSATSANAERQSQPHRSLRRAQAIETVTLSMPNGATRQQIAFAHNVPQDSKYSKVVRDLLDEGIFERRDAQGRGLPADPDVEGAVTRPTQDGYPAEILFIKEKP